MTNLMKAIELATNAHFGQFDKSGNTYILHPMRVMKMMETEDEKIVAILHDIVEDTNVTLDFIIDTFGNEIAMAVDAITHRKHEPREVYYKRVKANELAFTVKIADIKDNLNPERLNLLDEDTKNRLTTKYEKALKFLL